MRTDGANGAFSAAVFRACARIPKGKVSTYAEIVRAIGKPRAFRAVGNALNKNRSKEVPCHRVIRSDLSIGGFVRGAREKIAMLKREGVAVENGVVPERFLFHL